MTMSDIYTGIIIGVILTIVLFTLGFIFKKQWIKWVAAIPFVVSVTPLIYLFIVFGH